MSDPALLDRTTKLSLREKLGYGVGDFGFNLYWTTIASFLAAFYTDVFGISAAAAGTMMLVTKIVDACTDPVMGAVADRTRTRFGKFRPYLLWAGLPMAGAAVLTFTTPDLDETGKLIWAYGTYTMMMLMYTVLSTPYSALSGVMTARLAAMSRITCRLRRRRLRRRPSAGRSRSTRSRHRRQPARPGPRASASRRPGPARERALGPPDRCVRRCPGT